MKNIENLITEYDDFRYWLKNDLKNQNEINQGSCYLIDENWINNLENCIDKFYNTNNKFSFPSQNPKLINNFSELINCIQKNQKLDFINHSLINYKYRNLKKNEIIYFVGNNKIIIDFNDYRENKALLIDNPFNKNQIRNNSYVIIKNNNPNQLYIDLLSIRYNFNNVIKSKYNKIVIPFEKYIKKINNDKNPLKKDLLRIFINIFYYEKALNKNKRDIFNNKENDYFYLIEPEWINKYKDHYHYSELFKLLSKENYKMNYNYNDLDKYINDIIDKYINEEVFDFDLKNNKFINRNSNKINSSLTTKQYYIMHPKIFGLIQKYESINNKIDLEPKKLIIKNNNYIFIDYYGNNIFIGDFNNNLFTFKYVLSYNSDEILESELEYLFELNYSIREYIKNSHCNENESKVQKIMNNEEVIGELRILNINESNYRKINNIQKNKPINKRNNSEIKSNTIIVNKNNHRKILSFDEETKDDSIEDTNKENLCFSDQNIKYNISSPKANKEIKKIKNYEKANKNEIKNNKSSEEITTLNSTISKKNEEIENLKDKINELKNIIKENELSNKERNMKDEEINKRYKEIIDKEREFNKKINFLEDRENQLEKEEKDMERKRKEFQQDLEDNKRIRKENNELNRQNEALKNEIKILQNQKRNLNNGRTNKYKDLRKEPILSYLKPTLVGLNNIGATCFMNSTLQCLSQTKALTNFFLDKKHINKITNNNIAVKNKNALQLSPAFLELINKLWDDNGNKSFSPNKFMNIINNMNPLFKTGQAGDAKDFIIFILEQLHKELKSSVNKSGNKNQQLLNQYDKNNAFNHFFNDFKKECSIISDIFFGFTETTNECLYCKNWYNSNGQSNPICYNYGIFNCLIFPLEEVKNMKYNNMKYNNMKYNNNSVSLDDCFYYNQKSEYFTGENRNYCNICKLLYDSIYTSKLFISPNVLVIILNRGKGNIYNIKLDFSERIDITKFVIQKEMPKIRYELYGVITHIGQSGPNAHFIASCKSPVDSKWYRYNDAIVSPINNIKNEVFNFGTPYILFYQKINY